MVPIGLPVVLEQKTSILSGSITLYHSETPSVRNFSITTGRSLRGFCPGVYQCFSGGRAFTVRVGILLLFRRLVHHLALALIQVKRAVHFLLLHKKLAHAFFMLKGTVKLLPIIGKRFYLSFKFCLFFFGKTIKAAQGVFNAGYGA